MGVQWPRWQRDEVRSPRAAGVVEGFMHQLNHQLVGGRVRVHVSHLLVKKNTMDKGRGSLLVTPCVNCAAQFCLSD